MKELEKLQQQKEKRKKGTGKKARCSTTDPQARVMKMGDGGFRPAYNVQFATDGDARIIAGVDLTNSGSDRGQMGPMQTQISERYGMVPKRYLVDCGFATKDDITSAELAGSMVYAPIHGEAKMLKDGNDPYERKKTDSDAMFAFRQRMKTEPAKDRYKKRAPIAEFPNALCRNHGLHQFRVRGPGQGTCGFITPRSGYQFPKSSDHGMAQSHSPDRITPYKDPQICHRSVTINDGTTNSIHASEF